MPGKNVTLQDIADHCGLSKSLVAQVLRDGPKCKAAPQTRQRILREAQRLNYVPNRAAKTLITRRHYTVGVIFPAVNSYFHELVVQLEAALAARDYYALFSYYRADANLLPSFRAALERMLGHGIDGVIASEYDEAAAERGLPLVTYGNDRPLMDCVFPDKLRYAADAVEYLCRRGHREIGFMGNCGDVRYKKIRLELARRRLEVNPAWMIDSPAFIPNGYEAMRGIARLRRRPTALIVHSDHMAIGALRAARDCGIAVPGDISLLSYDDLPEASYAEPPLTTFGQEYPLAAELLVDTLLARINNPGLPQQKRSFPLPLVERESVADLTPNRPVSRKSPGKIARKPLYAGGEVVSEDDPPKA